METKKEKVEFILFVLKCTLLLKYHLHGAWTPDLQKVMDD